MYTVNLQKPDESWPTFMHGKSSTLSSASVDYYSTKAVILSHVMSIFKIADLRYLRFYGFNNGFFEKPMYDFL